jgi:hypothetical protein
MPLRHGAEMFQSKRGVLLVKLAFIVPETDALITPSVSTLDEFHWINR